MNTKFQQKKILIAPLDWGLGHATRCIQIIKVLHSAGCFVTVAASGKTKTLLQNEFPEIDFLFLPGYKISYSKSKRWLAFKILIQIPKILKIIRVEKKWLENLLKTSCFDVVISDNRFGFYADKTLSVFITHQLKILCNNRWLDKQIQKINYKYINKFNECWVPDFEENKNVAGILSHPEILPATTVKYIGIVSRFKTKQIEISNYKWKWMVIISGPEPQRTIFENKMLHLASCLNENFLIIRGLSEKNIIHRPKNCTIFNHLNTEEMQAAMEASEFIISRCGYTTIMEILSLQKKSILIPTPGQTEQEYLAKHLMQQNWSYTFSQEKDFKTEIESAMLFNYSLPILKTDIYKKVITDFLENLV